MANDFKVEAVISATSDQIKAAFDQANKTVQESVDKMRTGLSNLSSNTKDTVGSMQSSFRGLETSLAGLGTRIAGLITGILSVKFMKDATLAVVNYKESIEALSRIMGITSEQASILNTALRMIGVSTETYIGANMRLGMQIKGNEDTLNQLGIRTRDVSGALLAQTTIFQNAIRTMYEYKAGADRNQFALYAFGRSAAQVYELIRLNNRVMTEAEEIARKFGLVLSDQASDTIERYSEKLNTLKLIFDALKIKIGSELLPEISRLAMALRELQPFFDVIVLTLKGLITVVSEVLNVFHALWETSKTVFINIADVASAVPTTIKKAWNEGLGEAAEYLSHVLDKAELAMKETDKRLEADQKALHARLSELWSKSGITPIPGMGGETPEGNKAFPEITDRMSKWRDDLQQMKIDEGAYFSFSVSREIAFWEEKLSLVKKGSKEWLAIRKEIFDLEAKQSKELADINLARLKQEITDERNSMTERMEAMEWTLGIIRNLYGTDSKEYQAALNEKTTLQKDFQERLMKMELAGFEYEAMLRKDDLAEQITLKNEELRIIALYGYKETELYRQKLKERVALELEYKKSLETGRAGTISGMTGTEGETEGKEWLAKQLQNEIELARQSADLAREQAAFKKEMGLITAKDLAEINLKIENDLLTIEMNTLRRISEIWEKYPEKWQDIQNQIGQITKERQRNVEKIEQGASLEQKRLWNDFLSPVRSAFSSMVMGMIQGTMTLKQGIQNILGSILQSFLNVFMKIAEQWIETQIMTLLFGKVTQKAAAISSITTDAARGAAAAFASTAAIPIVGPFMAPDVAAETYAAIMAFIPMAMASAARGWDVDRDALTMIHAREMVLPAELAEGIRGMVRGGDPQGRAITNNFRVQSWDSRDVRRFLKQHARELAGGLRGANRNFAFGRAI